MPFKYIPEIATADIAFEATGKTEEELFEQCALAVEQTMVDVKNVKAKEKREINLEADALDKLLFNFLSELLFYKDADRLLFSKFSVKISEKGKGKSKTYQLKATAKGEKIDLKRHVLHNDVKAITWHMFKIEKTRTGYKALIIVDV